MKIKIDVNTYGQNTTQLIYTRQFEAPSSSLSTFEVSGLDQNFLSHVVFQLHAFYLNVTLSFENPLSPSSHQNGTNLGFVLKPGDSNRTIYLWNRNFDDVQCMVALILYNKSAPIPGGCSADANPNLLIEETPNFNIIETKTAKASQETLNVGQDKCGAENSSEPLEYFTHFVYLDQMNFHHENYFEGIRSLMFTSAIHSGYQVKVSSKSASLFDLFLCSQAKQVYSPLKRYFERTPGTGIVFNSVVKEKNGHYAFYIPSVTYSCPPNTWNVHCSDDNMLKRALSVLLVLYSVVMTLNLVMPEFIEAIMNGMFLGSFATLVFLENHHLAMSSFEIFITVISGGLFVAAIFGTISLYFRIGRYFSKLTFSNILMAIAMETLYETITSPYWQLSGAFVASIGCFFINMTFSVFLGGLLLIMGLSHLLKVGNIHRIFVNNFHSLTSTYEADESAWSLIRFNFINYKIELNLFDYSLIVLYIIGAVLLTLRKEIYFRENPDLMDGEHLFSENREFVDFNRNMARNRRDKCLVGIKRSANGQLQIVSRCRRRHHFRSNVINERSPLISHWLASDESEDDVFESPNSNLRYMRTLSSDSKERIDAIQQFKH